MPLEPRYHQYERDHDRVFSVCSLVRDDDRYRALLTSFEAFGFTPENSEFLVADNRTDNHFDGYNWQKRMHGECTGKYVIYCHEDVELIDDDFDDLVQRLEELEERDPRWLIAGVAGGEWRSSARPMRRLAVRISDKYGENQRRGNVPCRAESLDECFIIMKRDKPVFGSYDLSGFHFYGPDLSLIAELSGGTVHVIDFHLRHTGDGSRGPSYRASRSAFVEKYSKIFAGRELTCTTGTVKLGHSWRDLQ